MSIATIADSEIRLSINHFLEGENLGFTHNIFASLVA